MQKYSGYQYTPAPQTEWDKLPMSEKTDVIKVCVHNGITSLQDIRTAYNNYKGGRNIFEGISDPSQKASEFGHFLATGGHIYDGTQEESQQMKIGRPYYSYDENGRKIDGTLNYNVTLPEIVIIPDSQKSPAQRNADERTRQKYLRDYDQHKAQEYTERQLSQAIRDWNNSAEKKALDFGIAATEGIGIGADIVSRLPIYSSLKGAQALDKATQSGDIGDYVETGLWLSPMLTIAGKEAYSAAKPVVQNIFKEPLSGLSESSISAISEGTSWTQEKAREAAKYAGKFFREDVLPRLQASRTGVDNELFTQNSPFLGRFALVPKPANIPGETSPMILESKGVPYTVELNKLDKAPFDDKLNTIIHEMREDMSFFHKGFYDEDLQRFMKISKEIEEARKKGNWGKVIQLNIKHGKELRRLEDAYNNAFLTSEERDIIESAYKIPKKPVIAGSKKLNEKVAENTRFRAKISRDHGNVTGKELDAEIDKLSDDELLDVLSDGNSYGQDYRKYIEENPKQREQMIANIKKALKTIGMFAGGAEILPDLLVTEDGVHPLE